MKKLYEVEPGYPLEELVSEIRSNGGRPIQLFPPSHLIAEIPDSVPIQRGSQFDSNDINNLDEQARIALLTYQRITRSPNTRAKITRHSWGAPGKEMTCHHNEPVQLSRARTAPLGSSIARSTGTPTSRYLMGRVAVAVVIVSREKGNGSNPTPEHLTRDERDNALIEAAEGLEWLAGLEPRAMVEFVLERHDIEINTAPNPQAQNTTEALESIWRDPVLARLNLPSGRKGYSQLAQEVRDRNNAQWGYVLFITRYPTRYYAYASYERVVQHYDNGPLDSSELNRVIAHETCHIFGAQDEYKESNCKCTKRSGHLSVENGNCESCASNFKPCIMEGNDLAMCNYTKGQLGWRSPLLKWNFILQKGTAVQESDKNFAFFFTDWNGDGIPDLVAIKKAHTGTQSTEVHIYSGASHFNTPILQTGTILGETNDKYQFCMVDWNNDGRPDLVAIKQSQTGTNSTELHILSGRSKFQSYLVQTGTGLRETDATYSFGMARYAPSQAGGRPDLIAVKKSNTGTQSTEIHIYSSASNYQSPILQTGTPIHETDSNTEFFIAPFDRASWPDLFAIKKSNTGTGSTEIHVLSGKDRFQRFVEQSGTALHPTNQTYTFAPLNWDKANPVIEIAAIKQRHTGTQSTEVHILRQ